MKPSALIVDDHPLYCDALKNVLHTLPDAIDVMTATSAEQGLRVAANMHNLQLVLLDLGLPGLNGIEAVRAFRTRLGHVPLVVVSATESRQEADAVLRAGAAAMLSKAVSVDVIRDVVLRVMSGARVALVHVAAPRDKSVLPPVRTQLTARQLETLALLLKGYGNKEIGLRLGVAEVTVKVHVSAVFRTLGVVNRTQAVLVARRLGLLEDASTQE